jgi:hypothetical protein
MHDGKATAGPKAGAQKKDLCEDVLACARKTNCAVAPDGSFDIVRCVCGDVSFDDCAAMQMMMPSGACYTEIAAGAETTMLADIGLRQIDPDFGTGAAFQLIQCDKKVCAKSCGICKADDPACVDKAAEGAAMGGAGMGGAMEPTAGMGGAGAGAAGAAGSAGTGH